MHIFPAIDIYGGKAVRLHKGDYSKMTVYNENPIAVAGDFVNNGVRSIHIVDLDGAKSGKAENIDIIKRIKQETNLFCEVGGGIRTIDTVKEYADAGIDRIILGTGAVNDSGFLTEALKKYGNRIAVGVDIKSGYVAIHGWKKNSEFKYIDFCHMLEDIGVSTIISTDISKDGDMKGCNLDLYKVLIKETGMNIIASGGISSISDLENLSEMNIYGAIIGKAYYTGAITLREAVGFEK